MDISFTNVLEGARQYFQGLPAGTGQSSGGAQLTSTATAAAAHHHQQQHRDTDGSVHSEQHSAVPYWDHQTADGQGGAANLPSQQPPQQQQQPQQQSQPEMRYHYEKQPHGYGGNYTVYQPASTSTSASSNYYEHQMKGAYANSHQQHQQQQLLQQQQKQQQYSYPAQNNSHSYGNYAQNPTPSSQSQEVRYNYKLYSQPATNNGRPQHQANYYQPPTSRVVTHQLPVVPTDVYRKQSAPVYQAKTVQNPASQNGVSYSDQQYKYYQTAHPSYTATTTTTHSVQYAQNYHVQRQPQQKHTTVVVNNSKQRRESPLDLSVKTVKTTADSTRSDYDDRRARYEAALQQQQYQTARAPKVDFLPNFSMPAKEEQQRKSAKAAYYYHQQSTSSLPRIDFPSTERKRSLEPPSSVPEKMPKVDTWRQTIDRQIEQRLSSYEKSRLEQERSVVNNNGQNRIVYGYTGEEANNYKGQSYQYAYAPQQSYQKRAVPQQHGVVKQALQQPTAPAATKKVLNLLRSTIQIKGAKKVEQYRSREVQQPSTDVMAPLQPKPGIVGRRNVSPFTAASLERNSNTPPAYKLHLPKAIDSVIFSDAEKDDQQASLERSTPTTDLDGLAAFLAARIRTKAELKQHAPPEQTGNNNAAAAAAGTVVVPPKPPTTPKKLFGRGGERKSGGVRSSSETSVFDFPDSDNEAEMPVLDRQSLVEMRKDRKTVPNQFTGVEDEPSSSSASPEDALFEMTCDTFLEQLKGGCGKKRGRRKKAEEGGFGEVPPIDSILREIKRETDAANEEKIRVKVEMAEVEDVVKKEVVEKSDSDSDTPLIVCKNKIKSNQVVVKIEPKIEPANDDSDSEVEGISKSMQENKKNVVLSTPRRKQKKSIFGDGSDFRPGWEEELYRYKKSLRMPRMLIQVTRPPNCQRLSTSLPDLDPYPLSPADLDEKQRLRKADSVDSDVDSNCSFNFATMMKSNYDSEEGSSSVKSLNSKNNSILDKLLERYGGKKRKRLKRPEDVPKVIPKSENTLELLPTPSLEVEKKNKVVKTESALLGFRKKTVDAFKDTFINSTNTIVGVNNEFTPIMFTSRTRTETRVLKEKATIREVFGEDRPASAPPVTCLDEIKPDEDDVDDKRKVKEKTTKLYNDGLFSKIKTEEEEDDDETTNVVEVKKEDDTRTDISSNDGEVTIKKRSKLRNIRRKFSSGFDYIRKKKKQVKREPDAESELKAKAKKRAAIVKAQPESVQDIQKEIKMWVLNKGVGETHLHRASRSGYVDITAYCLEKMSCNPSPKDNAGYTPLHEACSKGHLDIARLLLQYGAHASESAQGGIRPLHEAAENGFTEIVRLLLSYGADATLATYSGITPLQLAVDETTITLLQQHLEELQGKSSEPWRFLGPADFFDSQEQGYDPLAEVPDADVVPEEDDVELEVSEQLLPNLYTLPGSDTDRWILLQDLSNILKIKSKETLLRQLNMTTPTAKSSDFVKELKTVDFLEQARCCQFLNANEKLNTRSSKIFLVKYTDKVKRLLNVEKVIINVR